jgi:hypothetical protein
LASLSPAGRESIRHPHPEILHILDSRLLLDDAARLVGEVAADLGIEIRVVT